MSKLKLKTHWTSFICNYIFSLARKIVQSLYFLGSFQNTLTSMIVKNRKQNVPILACYRKMIQPNLFFMK